MLSDTFSVSDFDCMNRFTKVVSRDDIAVLAVYGTSFQTLRTFVHSLVCSILPLTWRHPYRVSIAVVSQNAKSYCFSFLPVHVNGNKHISVTCHGAGTWTSIRLCALVTYLASFLEACIVSVEIGNIRTKPCSGYFDARAWLVRF